MWKQEMKGRIGVGVGCPVRLSVTTAVWYLKSCCCYHKGKLTLSTVSCYQTSPDEAELEG